MKKKNVIIIFGFSGAGKSTLADRLGKRLRLRVVHPSSILRELLQKKTVQIQKSRAGKGFWESAAGVRLFKDRLKEKRPMDMVSDRILLRELAKGEIVMDSWTMPWLSRHGFKIYLRTSSEARAHRVAKRSRLTLAQAKRIVRMKDEQTRKLNVRLYGFDIKKDIGVFDLIVDTDDMTAAKVLRVVDDAYRSRVGEKK